MPEHLKREDRVKLETRRAFLNGDTSFRVFSDITRQDKTNIVARSKEHVQDERTDDNNRQYNQMRTK
eukprot:202276-Amphidinium_carterae.1